MVITDFKKDSTVYPISRRYSTKKIDRTLHYQKPVSLDDIIIVTEGTRKNTGIKFSKILERLQGAGYRASEKKSEFFLKKNNQAGARTNQAWNKTEQRKHKSYNTN